MKHTVLFMLFCILSLSYGNEQKSYNRLQDQVTIVTGASKGIGKGISQVFAKEGAKLVLVARSEKLLQDLTNDINANGGEATYILADMKDENSLQAVIDKTIEKYGRIDILCHNAGVYPGKRLDDMQLDEWRHVIDVNLTSTFLLVNKCLPIMKSQGKGKIVVTSSISGPKVGLPGQSNYTASKAGINGFIKTAAIELAKYNIQINSVKPGNILTEGLQEVGQDYLDSTVRAIPAGRIGEPKDIAYAMLFLASQEANFITGQSLVVDGGQILPESHYCEY